MSERAHGRRVGQIVGGRYRVDDYLGHGGMGEVYASTHLATGARVALKFLLPVHAADDKVCERFVREARAATAIRHPNVIVIQDLFDDADGVPVMVMELLRGESLGVRLKRVGKIELSEAVPIFLCVARAICAAHAVGVVHRDLKPDNIFLLEPTGENEPAKVLDFGIAKIIDSRGAGLASYASSTRHGSLVGTIPYMSYEQAMGEHVDGRTDVWSFAVTMVEALSGRRPLQFGSISEMFVAMLQHRVPRVQTLLPELPPAIADMLAACLVKESDKRAPDLTHAVSTLQDHMEQRSGLHARPVRRARWVALGLIGAAAIVVALNARPSADAPTRSVTQLTPADTPADAPDKSVQTVVQAASSPPASVAPKAEVAQPDETRSGVPPAPPPKVDPVVVLPRAKSKPPRPERVTPSARPSDAGTPAEPRSARSSIIETLPAE